MIMEQGPWAPYQPAADNPWDLRKVAHLHRRAGFGATWAELQRDLTAGPAKGVDRLLDPRAERGEEQDVLAGLRHGVLTSSGTEVERLKAYWLYRILFHPDVLHEKMTLFWHNHFATSNAKVKSVPFMLGQNELLRRHALGDFAELLTAIISDPAMLVWLDGGDSRKEKPNENFAREFLELFTLGIGHYTEKDIREAARAFTGWVPLQRARPDRPPDFRFNPARFDDGVKTFLGQTGRWKAEDIVRITLEQPACARFLCRKFYRFFIADSDEPAAELIEPLAEEFRSHGYSIRRVVGTVLRSRHFYSQAAYRKVVKSPVEFSAGLLRTLEVPRASINLPALAHACKDQGQDLFYPPSVKGWDQGRGWITSATVLGRGNWAADVVWGNEDWDMRPYDPAAWARHQGIAAERTTEALIELLLQGDLSPGARALVRGAAADREPDSLRKALQLLLQCPEYQLA
jgi:uncharacterized protein (DUF1800 family)